MHPLDAEYIEYILWKVFSAIAPRFPMVPSEKSLMLCGRSHWSVMIGA